MVGGGREDGYRMQKVSFPPFGPNKQTRQIETGFLVSIGAVRTGRRVDGDCVCIYRLSSTSSREMTRFQGLRDVGRIDSHFNKPEVPNQSADSVESVG